MPRDSRSQSPVSHPAGDRHYRDRSDRPKRKDREGSEDGRKKIKLPKKEHQYPSVNELKKRIRDVKRLLNKADLPADVRVVQERALAGYENDLEEEMQRRHRSAMIKKYHFVRFLDRKTASKDVKRLERLEQEVSKSDLDAASKEKKLAALTQKLHIARVNLNYTIYYPLTEKYIALYAAVKKSKDGTAEGVNDGSDPDTGYKLVHATKEEKPSMWPVVEKCMKDGTLELLREGKLDTPDVDASDKTSRKTDKNKQNLNKTDKAQSKSKKSEHKDVWRPAKSKDSGRAPNVSDEKEDDSDGGFFEM
ncbi:rRNA-processing protein efg1 [Aspergillus ambiguus]|uniref:Efg1 domain-containing protein n=1 Tax=Aspergillus ambiguus TaxID=176160 RepID=UPI003CCCC7EC